MFSHSFSLSPGYGWETETDKANVFWVGQSKRQKLWINFLTLGNLKPGYLKRETNTKILQHSFSSYNFQELHLQPGLYIVSGRGIAQLGGSCTSPVTVGPAKL